MDQGSMEEFDNSEDFAALLDAYEKHEKSSVSQGVIVEIREADGQALVDVGKKQEAVINLQELMDEENQLRFAIGDTIKVVITGYRNERPHASHQKAIRKEKTEAFIVGNQGKEEELAVEGKIVKKNRGGYVVLDAEGVEFFMPMSHAALNANKNAIGKAIKAIVIKLDQENGSIVVSRKKFLDQQRKVHKETIEALMEEGRLVEGEIKKITSYGMFVEVEGVQGLVHYSEISYKGPVNPSALYQEGDRVTVKAIGYDPQKRHLSLSIKQTQPDPWDEIAEQLEVGDTIKVIVSNIEPYGAFVDLGNDVEGFLHISEISWDKDIKNPKEYLNVGDEIDVEVIEINHDDRRLRVSLKNLQPKPFEEFLQSYRVGDIVTGKVTSTTDFGAFVKIGKVEGLLHNQDISWSKGVKSKDLYKSGDEVKVKIIHVDEARGRISLSAKALEESPVEKFVSEHQIGNIIQGTIRDIKDFGVFVQIQEGVDALIRKEDLGPINPEELNKGDEIEAVLTTLDAKNNRIRMSVRRLERQKEKEVLKEINKDDERLTIGDIIKDQL